MNASNVREIEGMAVGIKKFIDGFVEQCRQKAKPAKPDDTSYCCYCGEWTESYLSPNPHPDSVVAERLGEIWRCRKCSHLK